MAVDLSTLDSGTPRSLDGRVYPEKFRPFEAFDEEMLSRAANLPKFTFDDLAAELDNWKALHALGHWMTSAEWRVLIERVPPDPQRPWTYRVTQRGHDLLKTLS
ncbi:MAG TPA: hypothetical protein VN238_00865 [Solirubrobacteraceae bacterium]|nr:hypothetical protein [Solirubrobacteraceae bacterium]